MTDGLITRIGRWLDNKWESKATEAQLDNVRIKLNELVTEMRTELGGVQADMESRLKALERAAKDETPTKESSDLKKRLEQLELYVGMKRVADPTKPPVAKSAFAM